MGSWIRASVGSAVTIAGATLGDFAKIFGAGNGGGTFFGFGAGCGGATFGETRVTLGLAAFVTFLGWRLGRVPMSINRTRMGPGLGKAMDDMAVQPSKKMRSR